MLKTVCQIYKIRGSEGSKDFIYLANCLKHIYIFHAEDIVRGRRPLYFIYPVSLNFVLLIMLQFHFYICKMEQFVNLFKHLKSDTTYIYLVSAHKIGQNIYLYFVCSQNRTKYIFIFCLLTKSDKIYIYILSAHKIGHYLYLYSVWSPEIF